MANASIAMHHQAFSVQAALIAAMAIWGLNLAAVKMLTRSFDPTVLAAVRMAVACVALTAIVASKRCGIPRPGGMQLVAIVACGFLMVYLNQILFAEGMTRSTATSAALIMALSPLASSLIAAVAFRKRITLQRLAGVLLGFLGVGAVVLSHPESGVSTAGTGDLLLMAGVVSFALGGAIVQRLSREVYPLAISWAIYLVGTALLMTQVGVGGNKVTLLTLFRGWLPWALVLFRGDGHCGVQSGLEPCDLPDRRCAHRRVPPLGSGVCVVFAALFLAETLTLWHLGGYIAVTTGTWLGTGAAAPNRAPAATPVRSDSKAT